MHKANPAAIQIVTALIAIAVQTVPAKGADSSFN